jgi:hypothetical protein
MRYLAALALFLTFTANAALANTASAIYTINITAAGGYSGPCDVITGGCVAAHSMSQKMVGGYGGPAFELIDSTPAWTGTASISGTTLTVATTASGAMANGLALSGVGSGFVPAVTPVTYTSGCSGSTCTVSQSQTAASVTAAYAVLDVGFQGNGAWDETTWQNFCAGVTCLVEKIFNQGSGGSANDLIASQVSGGSATNLDCTASIIVCAPLFVIDTATDTPMAITASSEMGLFADVYASAPPAFVPLCSVSGITCQYAYSLSHQVVSGATKAFQLTRQSDGTTHDVGFLSNGTVNLADAMAFCAGGGAATNGQDCNYTVFYDQSGAGCDLTPWHSGFPPPFAVWPPHAAPVMMTPFYAGNTSAAMDMHNTACSAYGATAARSIILATTTQLDGILNGGQGLEQQCPPCGAPPYSHFSTSPFYQSRPNIDYEGSGTSFPTTVTMTPVNESVFIFTYSGSSTNHVNIYYNNVHGVTNASPGSPLSIESTMDVGNDGDQLYPGNTFFDTMIWTTQDISALATNVPTDIYNNLHLWYPVTPSYTGPGDLYLYRGVIPPPTSNDQPTWLNYFQAGWGVRRLQGSYAGPALNVCQGVTATCEDIGFVNNALDTATANSFCGPSNCTVQIAYNQGLPILSGISYQGGTYSNGGNGNWSAPTAAARPALKFNAACPAGLNSGIPCLAFSGSQRLCASPNAYWTATAAFATTTFGRITFEAIAERTSGTSVSAIFGDAAGGALMGLSTANTAYVQPRSGTSATLAGVNDNVWHAFDYEANETASVKLFVDAIGSANTTGTQTDGGNPPYCWGSTNGTNNFTGAMTEALIFTDFLSDFGSLPTLISNQSTYYGPAL